MYTDGIVQGGWEATVDQPGPGGILIALPGGAGARISAAATASPATKGPHHRPWPATSWPASLRRTSPGPWHAYNGKAYYAWSAGDPHIGGAYSYFKTGQYTSFNGIQGRRHGNLHFAGEHTSVNFQGFMEGALRSGYRCAAEVTRRAG